MIAFIGSLIISIILTIIMLRCAGSEHSRFVQILLVFLVVLSYFTTILLGVNAKTQTVGSVKDISVVLMLIGIQ